MTTDKRISYLTSKNSNRKQWFLGDIINLISIIFDTKPVLTRIMNGFSNFRKKKSVHFRNLGQFGLNEIYRSGYLNFSGLVSVCKVSLCS